MNVIHNN